MDDYYKSALPCNYIYIDYNNVDELDFGHSVVWFWGSTAGQQQSMYGHDRASFSPSDLSDRPN